jgi:hypothetical protein
MKWSDVKYYQFEKLQELLKIDNEEERLIEVAQLLLGEEVLNLPVAEFSKKVKELDFLQSEMPSGIPPKKITVNGRKYYLDCLLGNVTTAQYIDFTNHSKTNDICKMLSVFLIPEGHKYNDGYDILEVMKDIKDLPVTVVYDTAFFFGKHYSEFMRIFQRYSIKDIEMTNLPKEAKKNLIKVVKDSVNLVLYPLSSNFAK